MSRIHFSCVPLEVLEAVLRESARQREHAQTNLAAGERWAPQVTCAGSADGRMLFSITTASFTLTGLLALAARAEAAQPAAHARHEARYTTAGAPVPTAVGAAGALSLA